MQNHTFQGWFPLNYFKTIFHTGDQTLNFQNDFIELVESNVSNKGKRNTLNLGTIFAVFSQFASYPHKTVNYQGW